MCMCESTVANGRNYGEDSEGIKRKKVLINGFERVWPDFCRMMIILTGGHERPIDRGEQLS